MSDLNRNRIAVRRDPALSYGALGIWDERYRRRIAERRTVPVTAEQWADYDRALAMLEELRESPYFEDGGPEECATVEPPRSHVETIFAETESEWLARCAQLNSHTGESFFRKAP